MDFKWDEKLLKSDTKLSYFEIVLSCEKYSFDDVKAFMIEWCDKFTFQKEKGDKTGFVHYQCRIKLKVARRYATIKELVKSGTFPAGHIEPTSNTCKNNTFYVVKEDTRIDGPWTDKDKIFNEIYIPSSIEEFKKFELYPWQQKVTEIATKKDNRSIYVIVDEEGNTGKSSLVRHLEFEGLAVKLPTVRSAEDLMQMCHGIVSQNVKNAPKCFLFDMPRGMKKEKLAEFYSGVEEIKNGYCYDKRYAFKKVWFEIPQIIIFSNCYPDVRYLSNDRWNILKILEKDLVF